MGKKIAIIGNSGSGKSTFALVLSSKTSIPCYEFDALLSTNKSENEMLSIIENILNGEEWILDGNPAKYQQLVFNSANIIIYFKINRVICLWNAFIRSAKRGFRSRRNDKRNNLIGKITTIKWILRYRHSKGKGLLNCIQNEERKNICIVRNNKEMIEVLNKVVGIT
jgi:adenylate kinase family enzyme